MKAISRSLVMIFVALIAVPALAVTQTVTTAIQLLATTALILGGTQHPLGPPTDGADFVNNYFGQATGNYIGPANNQSLGSITTYAVIYPAEFAPVFGTTTFGDSVAAVGGVTLDAVQVSIAQVAHDVLLCTSARAVLCADLTVRV